MLVTPDFLPKGRGFLSLVSSEGGGEAQVTDLKLKLSVIFKPIYKN